MSARVRQLQRSQLTDLVLTSKKSLRRGLTFAAFCFSAAACTTAQKGSGVSGVVGSAEGQWHGKALVKNAANGKSGTLTLDVLAKEPSQLRMELVGPFGVHVASIALNGEEVRYVLTREKRYVSGPAEADALVRLVPVRIPPKALLAILFDRQFPKEDWTCANDPATQLNVSCTHKGEPVTVRWLERNGRARRLQIAAAEAEVEMYIEEAKTKAEFKPETFVLSAPSGYKQERL
jgi:hypothetical protein